MLCRLSFFGVLASVWLALVGTSHADLILQDYSAARHDRFANDPNFVGNPYNWSGVGLTVTNKWVAMVSSSYFLCARHNQPAINETINFYTSNDPNSTPLSYTVQSGVQIAGTDLWLGRLNQPTSFSGFNVAAATDMTGQEIYLFGLASGYGVGQAQRLGRNIVDDMVSNIPLTDAVGNTFIYDFDPTGGVGPDEAMVEIGDSGGPTFVIVNGQPALVGIHWFKFSGATPPLAPTGSGDSFVSDYLSSINAAMVGEQLTIVPVPEPSSIVLLSLSAAGPWMIRRMRRKKA